MLTVDDLDRCDPQVMLNLIENLKLMLEQPKLKEVVRILMLVDDEILSRAIATKYADTIGEHDGDDIRARVINDHIDKLFICYLRLPHITHDEAIDLQHKHLSIYSLEPSVEVDEQTREAGSIENQGTETSANPESSSLPPEENDSYQGIDEAG